jgi:hypothetical protein
MRGPDPRIHPLQKDGSQVKPGNGDKKSQNKQQEGKPPDGV